MQLNDNQFKFYSIYLVKTFLKIYLIMNSIKIIIFNSINNNEYQILLINLLSKIRNDITKLIF